MKYQKRKSVLINIVGLAKSADLFLQVYADSNISIDKRLKLNISKNKSKSKSKSKGNSKNKNK